MNDPHVVALIYDVKHGDSFDYRNAKLLVRDEPGFLLTVENKKARFEMKEHFATERSARASIHDYIRVWEFDACLESGPDSFQLEFAVPEIVDRDPTARGLSVSARAGAPTVSMRLTVVPSTYPSPPPDMAVRPHDSAVDTMFQRYMRDHSNQDALSDLAYFCLTILEDEATSGANFGRKERRRRTAAKFDIEVVVLNKVGDLSSTKGGKMGARKVEGTSQDFSTGERLFLRHAVKRMIRRAAEKAYDPARQLEEIKLSDLPPL